MTNDGTPGPWPAALFNTATGMQISTPGLDGVVSGALMPTFSPDGKRLVVRATA